MVVSLLFIGSRLWAYRQTVGDQVEKPFFLWAVLLLAIVYASAGLLLAAGWYSILDCRNEWNGKLPWSRAWKIYGRTQIAKYIPGNIFHFAGRHLLARNAGALHAQLVTAATGEIVMTLAAAGLYSLLATRILFKRMPVHFVLPVLVTLSVCLGLFIFLGVRFKLRSLAREIRVANLLVGELYYLIFFAVSIALFQGVIFLVSGQRPDLFLIAGGYAAAWAIGFVVPGAPGGFGVREAVLITFLSGVLREETILLAAIVFRVVTTLGDCLFFLAANRQEKAIDDRR